MLEKAGHTQLKAKDAYNAGTVYFLLKRAGGGWSEAPMLRHISDKGWCSFSVVLINADGVAVGTVRCCKSVLHAAVALMRAEAGGAAGISLIAYPAIKNRMTSAVVADFVAVYRVRNVEAQTAGRGEEGGQGGGKGGQGPLQYFGVACAVRPVTSRTMMH